MKTNNPRSLILSTVILAVSLSAFTGCSQVPPATQAQQPVAAPASAATEFSPAELQAAVDEAYAKFKDDRSGKNADYIPYLAGVDSNLFAVVIVTTDGHVYSAGDTNYLFSIQSCSKVFTMCQVMEESGPDASEGAAVCFGSPPSPFRSPPVIPRPQAAPIARARS